MKAGVVLLALLVLVPLGLGQFKETVTDDFEDDPIGFFPDSDWYTVSQTAGTEACGTGSGFTVAVCDVGFGTAPGNFEAGLAGSALGVMLSRYASVPGIEFNLNEASQLDQASFWWSNLNGQGGRLDVMFSSVRACDDTGGGFGCGTGYGDVARVQQRTDGSVVGGPLGCGDTNRIEITFNWTDEEFLVACYDSSDTLIDSDWKSFVGSGEIIEYIAVRTILAVSGAASFDELEVTFPAVEPEPEPEPGPGNLFDDDGAFYGGNKSALADALQITEAALETGMGILFILVGAAIGFAVMKFMGAIFGAAVGLIFSLAFGLISLWVIAFILGLVVAFFFLRRNSNG